MRLFRPVGVFVFQMRTPTPQECERLEGECESGRIRIAQLRQEILAMTESAHQAVVDSEEMKARLECREV